MKYNLIIALFFIPLYANAQIYNNSNFRPYIGIDAGLNIADFTTDTDLDNNFYSATINGGLLIGNNFGIGLFFTHSSTNNLEYQREFTASNHELYYLSYGFDVFGYYDLTRELEFFTSFGVGHYQFYNKNTYISPSNELSDTTSLKDTNTRIGIGIMYKFPGNHISALLQYQYVPLGNTWLNNMNEFSFGIRYTF